MFETKNAIANGSSEIDMVINIGFLKDGRYEEVEEEIKACEIVTNAGAEFIKTSTGFIAPDNIYSKVNDINIIQKYAPQLKIEIYGGVDTYKLANQLLTGGADLIGSDNGYEIVDKYRTLRENTQVTPKPIRFD